MHRDLLDYLAFELQRGTGRNWLGLKSLHRLIVTSAAYRQSSNARPRLADRDPDNRLLARQQRRRLEAELIRDVSLAASGLLCSKIGGPSVYPHQIDGILVNRATPATWTTSHGEDVYRRGMYTWVWRLTPHPNLPLFDAPDGVTACTRRDSSNVPVQALALLNDSSYYEAARELGKRVIGSSTESDEEKMKGLVQNCLSRQPSRPELALLQNLITQQRQQFEANRKQTLQASGGLVSTETEAIEHATWTIVSRVIMNLDEFITRE